MSFQSKQLLSVKVPLVVSRCTEVCTDHGEQND